MLKYRLISASVLLSLLGIAVFGYRWDGAGIIFALMAVAMSWIGLGEYFNMMDKLGIPGFPLVTKVFGCGYLAVAAVAGIMARSEKAVQPWTLRGEYLVMYLFFLACVVATMRSNDLSVGVKSFVASLGGFFYLCWTLSFLVKIYFFANTDPDNYSLGPYLLFFAVMITKCGDIGGYTCGKTCYSIFGKTHKLVPKLSPGKSWEGFVGCLVFSALAGAIMVAIAGGEIKLVNALSEVPFIGKEFPPKVLVSYPTAIILGVLFAGLGLVGDLIESCLKRASGVKDSGTILPGMGGMLDALDSLVITAPLFYLYLLFI